jgi:antitoxin (DNA-binding transcriptional repressor) of toxin-antitoxin stability system
MKAVAIRELKNRLSAYLREVARGEVVLVTDRGRVVAELRRPSGDLPPTTLDHALTRLQGEGALTPGLPQDKAAYRRTRVHLREGTQRLLDAERAEP